MNRAQTAPERASHRIARFAAAALAGTFLAGLCAAEVPTVTFRTQDIEGHLHTAAETGATATVWIFIAHDCPISNGYAPTISAIAKEYAVRRVSLNIVYAEPGLTLSDLRAHARAYNMVQPLCADPDGRLALTLGILATPEVAVVDARSCLVYRGRIDDLYPRPGHQRTEARTHDLRDALEEVLAGRPVTNPRTVAVGCTLETHIQSAASSLVP